VVSIAEGDTITSPLKESGVFPPMVTQMISVGEKTGGLDEMLNKIADFYDEEVDAAVSALTSVIEPVVIVFMGIVIGGILIAMYLPMFDIIGKIG
jgi:type IV pilus assembly protein PilC